MDYEGCIKKMWEASGGKLTEEDLHELLNDMLRRANRNARPGETMADRITRFAEEYGRTKEEAEAVLERNAYQNATKRAARRGIQAGAPTPDLGMEANLVGVNTPFAGSRDSVDIINKTLEADWLGGMDIDLRKAGLDKYAASGMDDVAAARELAELNKPDGKPGVTGNDRAKSLAAILHKYQQAGFATLNRSGGWAKPFYGYVARTVHDADRIRGLGKWDLLTGHMPPAEAARTAWAGDMLREVNLDRTFGGRDEALKALPQMWSEFAAGRHLSGVNPDEVNPLAQFGPNQGRRGSSSRVIYWNSPEAWARYNAKYGAGTTMAAVAQQLRRTARISALMQKFGTNPTAAFEADLRHWGEETIGDERKQKAFDAAVPKLRNQMAVVDGSANIPANQVSAARLSAWMRWQRWTKLGSAPISALQDLATKASELRYQGVPFLDRYKTALTDYAGRSAMSAEDRVRAELLRAGVDGEIHSLANRFELGESKPGLGSTIDNLFFKYTGLTPMTDNQRMGAQMIMARNLGLRKGQEFAALPHGLRSILNGTGIDGKAWDLLRSSDWGPGGMRDFFEPSIVDRLDPHALASFAGTRGVEDAGADLKQKILQVIHDRGLYAVIEPGARTKAMMLGSTRAGTLPGNALRLLMQFKSFNAAMLEKTWGREIYGGAKGMDRMAGVAEMLIGSMALGYVSMSLRDMLYGKTPRDPRDPATIAAAIAAGGGLSIYGDMLFGSWTRYGSSFGDSVLGPTFGQVSNAADLVSSARAGQEKDAMAQAVQAIKQNVPFQNIWLTRILLDHLLLYRMQEAISPGFLERQQAKTSQLNYAPWLLRSRQHYWLPPTAGVH